MNTTVFFGDILGFSRASQTPGSPRAIDALSDVATILSSEHSVARYLQSPVWHRRFGLSDSIFLLAGDPEQACTAAAEIFFNLAYYNSRTSAPVLMRGAITTGEVRELGPLFPDTSTSNLVGDAVVRAVELEKCGLKGPRLLVSDEVMQALSRPIRDWMLDHLPGQPWESLWLLTPDPASISAEMIADVCRSAVEGLRRHAQDPQAVDHYVAYVDVVTRSLLRLRGRDRNAAAAVVDQASLKRARSELQVLLVTKGAREVEILNRLDDLLGDSP